MTQSMIPGSPASLGASISTDGVNFAVHAPDADRVELCLFSTDGSEETARLDMPEKSEGVWHGFLPGAGTGVAYGYRAHGPYDPERGFRFNGNKLLLDPYAKDLTGDFSWTDAHYGYEIGHPDCDLSFDKRDNSKAMLKGVVVDPGAFAANPVAGRRPWGGTSIYECHVRGFTINMPGLSDAERGTVQGLSRRDALEYIKSLGMTAIELMPAHAFVDDRFLVDRGLSNYWGYNTLSYFAIMPRYLGANGVADFRDFVNAAHEMGLEVIMDVAYNHTAETDHMGPTLSYRGLDNAGYYRLQSDSPRYYNDVSACGVTMDFESAIVRRLCLDSLQYFHETFQIDGYRFDLAAAHGVDPYNNFHTDHVFFKDLREQSWVRDVKLIAEPWMPIRDGMCATRFPHDWAEWNGGAKDRYRRFWHGDHALSASLGRKFAGSPDYFAETGRGAWASVNYVACHDGATLADAVRFGAKHNEANGEENRDGPEPADNAAHNYGVEGFTEDPELEDLRNRQQRNILASAYMSLGTLMLLAGDEYGRTQKGNNNAYAQDNEISWHDWNAVAQRNGQTQLEFTKRLAEIRSRHPALANTEHPHIDAFRMHGPDGAMLNTFTDTLARPRFSIEHRSPDAHLLVALNASADDGEIVIPQTPDGGDWTISVDTFRPYLAAQSERVASGGALALKERSLMILEWSAA